MNQLLTELDGTSDRSSVFIVAATNRPDIIDPALLRPGRLDKTLFVPLPDASGRGAILQACARKSPVAAGVDLAAIGARCEGFSGADLASVLREAAVSSLKVCACTARCVKQGCLLFTAFCGAAAAACQMRRHRARRQGRPAGSAQPYHEALFVLST